MCHSSTRSSARVRVDQALAVGRRDHRSTSASTTGSLMPMVLRLPGSSAAARAPEVALLVARRQRLGPQRRSIMSKSKLSMRLWYCAVSTVRTLHVDAEALEVLHEGQHHALERRVVEQDLEGELAPGLASISLPSLTSQPASLSSASALRRPRADVARAVGHRRREFGLVNTSSGILPRNGSRIFSSSRRGQAARPRARSCRSSAGAHVDAVEQVLVGPFEVEGIAERLAHPRGP